MHLFGALFQTALSLLVNPTEKLFKSLLGIRHASRGRVPFFSWQQKHLKGGFAHVDPNGDKLGKKT